MKYRHLELDPEAPVEAQPREAIVDTLERGDLGDWQPLAMAIARDPLGEFAITVRRLIDAYPEPGSHRHTACIR